MSGKVYRIVLDGDQAESEHGFTFDLEGDAVPVAVAGHSEDGDTLEILHHDSSQDVTYIQVLPLSFVICVKVLSFILGA